MEDILEDTNGTYQQFYTNAGNLLCYTGRCIETIKLIFKASKNLFNRSKKLVLLILLANRYDALVRYQNPNQTIIH